MKREPTEMEIRVAKAMWEGGLRRIGQVSFFPEMPESYKPAFIDSARAAIRALYNLTHEMSDEGLMAFVECQSEASISSGGVTIGKSESDDPLTAAWRAMIDTASPPID